LRCWATSWVGCLALRSSVRRLKTRLSDAFYARIILITPQPYLGKPRQHCGLGRVGRVYAPPLLRPAVALSQHHTSNTGLCHDGSRSHRVARARTRGSPAGSSSGSSQRRPLAPRPTRDNRLESGIGQDSQSPPSAGGPASHPHPGGAVPMPARPVAALALAERHRVRRWFDGLLEATLPACAARLRRCSSLSGPARRLQSQAGQLLPRPPARRDTSRPGCSRARRAAARGCDHQNVLN
jgi:hypothetical protein